MDDITTLRRIVEEAARLIDGVRDDQRGAPTPCPDFTVDQLVTHVSEGAAMFAVAVEPGVDASGDWKTVGAALVGVFERLADLDAEIALPYGTFSGRTVLGQAIGEAAIHAADLARATGQAIADTEVYDVVLERARTYITELWRQDGVLGPERDAPAGASVPERLLAFAGREI